MNRQLKMVFTKNTSSGQINFQTKSVAPPHSGQINFQTKSMFNISNKSCGCG